MKYCVDCKHYARVPTEESSTIAGCGRTNATDAVTGAKIYLRCSEQRKGSYMIHIPPDDSSAMAPGEPTDSGRCGNEGRFFEQKEA